MWKALCFLELLSKYKAHVITLIMLCLAEKHNSGPLMLLRVRNNIKKWNWWSQSLILTISCILILTIVFFTELLSGNKIEPQNSCIFQIPQLQSGTHLNKYRKFQNPGRPFKKGRKTNDWDNPLSGISAPKGKKTGNTSFMLIGLLLCALAKQELCISFVKRASGAGSHHIHQESLMSSTCLEYILFFLRFCWMTNCSKVFYGTLTFI